MQSSPTFVIEPVPRIERQQLDHGPLGQIGRFIENKPSRPHSRLQRHPSYR